MANKNKNKNKNQKKKNGAPVNGGGKKRAKNGRKKAGVFGPTILSYARMIADPCSAQLVPGLYGSEEGFLGRFKKSYPLPAVTGATCGYVLWAPNYHLAGVNGGVAGGFGNIFIYQTTVPSYVPSNSTAVNGAFGAGLTTSTITASTIADPCYNFINGNTARDARLVSACIRSDYLGAMSDVSGQVVMVENLMLADLVDQLPSVNELFDYYGKTHRVSLDTSEVVYRPEVTGLERFLDPEDHALVIGATGAASAVGNDAHHFQPTVFGFAWRGLPAADLSKITVEFIKNIEWRPETGQGLRGNVPNSITGGVNMQKAALVALDQTHPGWNTPTYEKIASGVTTMAKAVWSGIAPSIAANGAKYVGRIAGNVAMGAARASPLLLMA